MSSRSCDDNEVTPCNDDRRTTNDNNNDNNDISRVSPTEQQRVCNVQART